MTDFHDVDLDKFKHLVSERALTGETMVLNMGPQHPSTHGVLRVILELDGEIVVNAIPDIGFLHTGIEKNMESKRYEQAEVMTDRADYMDSLGTNLAYCMAIEKLAELEVPARAQALRVILVELNRISNHLLFIASTALDLGALSMYFLCLRERDTILDIMELVSGQRVMTTFIRPGGVWRDVPVEFEQAVRSYVKVQWERLKQYESLLNDNPIFKSRTIGLGVINQRQCIEYGLTGPFLRATGLAHDIRKTSPYSGYEQYDFDIPTQKNGDIYDRYLVRTAEVRQSLRIIEQALDRLPYGPVRSNDYKFVPPPRSSIGVSMESLIHHFKLWTEGFSLPVGSVYSPIESPKGELGIYLESDGSNKPYRIHLRTQSFAIVQALPLMIKGLFVADVVATLASTDIVLGDVDR
jgi:NADH-quinone oxidoreductase subunit D